MAAGTKRSNSKVTTGPIKIYSGSDSISEEDPRLKSSDSSSASNSDSTSTSNDSGDDSDDFG